MYIFPEKKIPLRRKWQQKSLADCSPWSHRELNTTERLITYTQQFLTVLMNTNFCGELGNQ